MMVKKSDENSRALTLNETVGENYSLTSSDGVLTTVDVGTEKEIFKINKMEKSLSILKTLQKDIPNSLVFANTP